MPSERIRRFFVGMLRRGALSALIVLPGVESVGDGGAVGAGEAWQSARGQVTTVGGPLLEPAATMTPGPAAGVDAAEVNLVAGQENSFGQAGSWRWALYAGAGFDVNEADENYSLHYSASKFFTDDFNLSFELGGMYFLQSAAGADDTGGVNANLLVRWHFVNEETFSCYADAGAGLLYLGAKVPFDGSRFNWTPQAGIGLSLELEKARDIRLFGGVRWLHLSNANLADSNNNPGRDALLGYVGLDFPLRD